MGSSRREQTPARGGASGPADSADHAVESAVEEVVLREQNVDLQHAPAIMLSQPDAAADATPTRRCDLPHCPSKNLAGFEFHGFVD